MSLSYKDGESPDDFWGPLFLAYRDITGQAPIDKVAYPGVYITPACFPNNVYDGNVFESCISNLLSAQFRRLIFDIYWDVSNREFTFCPAELPRHTDNTTSTTTVLQTTPVTPAALLSTQSDLEKRQENTTDSLPSTTTEVNSTSAFSSAITTATSESGSALLQLGRYQCSEDLTMNNFFDLFKDYLDSTSSSVQARFHILQFNVHAAASPQDPEGQPRQPSASDMPTQGELLGREFGDDLGGYLYSPSDLADERRKLNVTWYQVSSESQLPILGYYDIFKVPDGQLATTNGWPSENYLLFTQYQRFLLTFGTMAPEMRGYDFQADGRVFLQNQTSFFREVAVNEQGIVTSGCYYNDESTAVARINNSWAVSSVEQLLDPLDTSVENLVTCGLCPTLNATFEDQTASSSYQRYQVFSQGTIFGWASGEPKNSSTASDIDGGEDQFRCVVLDASDAYQGHWRVVSCQEKHRAACRVGGQPFEWRLSPSEVLYTNAPEQCQDDAEFGTPRTGLENKYLYEQILDDLDTQQEASFRNGVWINLNALDEQDCWVTSGPNGSCSYQSDQEDRHSRQVLIPSIAALLILILAALIVVVKCGVNQRHSRVRRMGPGGWEYEGVPS